MNGRRSYSSTKRAQHVLTNMDIERRLADCSTCGSGSQIRPWSSTDGSQRWKCRLPHVRRRSSPEAHRRHQKRYREMQPGYGLTAVELRAMVERQGNLCAICLRPPRRGRLAIDHCHTTGKVRALLCTNCNAALGMFQEDPEIMRRAISYLAEHSE